MADNFHIYNDIAFLPADGHERYLEEGFAGVCTGGSAVVEVFSLARRITKNDLVTVLPLQRVSIREVSDDFSMTFFKVNKVLFQDIMSGLGQVTSDFFFFMRRNFRVRLNRSETVRFLGFCRVIDFRCNNDDLVFRRETIIHLLRIFYWDFYVYFQKLVSRGVHLPVLNSSKENIAYKFAMLVSEYYKSHREVAFYAGKLCISPLYLTRVVQEMNGQSAREVIADYTALGIKSLLRDATFDIKDVARQTGFSNQSSLSRFFRQRTGMSPSEYRRTIHSIR